MFFRGATKPFWLKNNGKKMGVSRFPNLSPEYESDLSGDEDQKKDEKHKMRFSKMQIIRRLVSIDIAVILLCFLPAFLYADEYPILYVEIADSINCEPIIKLGHTSEKLYIDQEFGVDGKYKGVFWCKNLDIDRDNFKYLLVVLKNSKGTDLDIIKWWNYPQSLSIFDCSEKIKGLFYSVSNEENNKLLDLTLCGGAFKSSFDGVEAIFIEDEEGWFYKIRD